MPQKISEHEQERAQREAEEFAKKVAQQVLNDPTGKTSRRPSATYQNVSKSQIEQYLSSPTANEKNLRNASIALYQASSRYRELLTYFSNLPAWLFTIDAVNFTPERVKTDAFRKQYIKACNLIESMNIQKTMREVTLTALREGAYYGVIWGGDGKSFILQKLNPDNCTIVSVSDGGVFDFAYDMSKVKEVDLPTYYPKEFTDMYNAYKATGNQYQVVPADISFCLKADPTIPDYSIPPFSAVLPTLYSIKAVEEMAEESAELQNYKMLSAKLPVDSNGVPTMTFKTAMQYYDHIANNLAEMVGLCLTPFEIKDHSFDQSGTAAQVDNIARATDNFFASAGTSATLHGKSDNTSAVTKLAIKTDESFAFSFMWQCQSIVNRFLKLQTGTQKFKIRFLPVSIFSIADMTDAYRNAMNYGMGKLEYLACIGVPQYDILNRSYIEHDLLDIDSKFTPMKTAATQSNEDQSQGRPTLPDSQVGDSGERARDGE